MKILSAKQMARLDRLSIKKHGISGRRLMGNAARACVEVLLEKSYKKPKSIVIVCGPGNNGGDGFAMSRLLREKKIEVDCFFLGKAEKLSEEARSYFQQLTPPPKVLKKNSDLSALRRAIRDCDWVVDGLFGTGLNRGLKGLFAQVLKILNKGKGRKFAIDMPSGVSGDSGEVMGEAFRAEITVTFETPKWGQVQASAWDYVGELIVRPIGLKKSELKKMTARAQWNEAGEVSRFFSPRVKDMNKGKAGRVLVVAGSGNMPGAGYLTALGALRTGAGLVTWALPEAILKKMKIQHPEVLFRYLPSSQNGFSPQGLAELRKLASGFHSLAVGPGMGQSRDLVLFLEGILKEIQIPMVLDADALNLMAAHPKLLKNIRGKILTPHPKEMSRLTGQPLKKILRDRLGVAKSFAKKYGCYLVLKSYRSVIANPKGEVWINSTGGPNLAVAGSGDVLTGAVASLLAQGLNGQKALLAGVYLHGKAGDRLAEKLGDRGTLASEVAREIPRALRQLL